VSVVVRFLETRDRLFGQKAAHGDDKTIRVVIELAKRADQRVIAAATDARIQKKHMRTPFPRDMFER